MEGEILTAAQVGDRLSLSKAQVYALAREGAIPHVRIGKAVRFRWSAIEAWLEAIERPGDGGTVWAGYAGTSTANQVGQRRANGLPRGTDSPRRNDADRD